MFSGGLVKILSSASFLGFAVTISLLSGCIDQLDKSNESIENKTLGVVFQCSKGMDLNSWPLSLSFKVRRNQNTKGTVFDFAGTTLLNYNIESVEATYQTEFGQRPNFPQNANVSFAQGRTILQVKKYKDYPTCQISFDNGSNIAKQVCNVESESENYRTKNFELPCRRVGKMRVYNNEP